MIRWLRAEGQILARLLARPLLWLLIALAGAGAVAAYQAPHGYTIDIGSPADQAYVRNFHGRLTDDSSGRSFRWSDTYGYVVLPGLGGGVPYTITLTLDPGRPNVPLTILVDGDPFLQQTFPAGWQTLALRVDATHPRALASRDLVLEVRAPAIAADDPPGEMHGVMLDQVDVSPPGAGFVAPAYAQLLYLAALVVLAYLLIGRALVPASLPQGRCRAGVPGWLPVVGAAGVAASTVGLLAAVRLPWTVAAPTLVAAGGITYLLLVLAEPVARRMAPQAGWGARAAAILVATAFLVRFGLMGLPQSVIIDLPWHMKWLNELLAGNWQALYFPGGLSEVPREWGLSVLIPKSPLFYFLAAPLALLPGDLETAVKGLACLLEASGVLFCYGLLARFAPGLGGWRAGLWAGLVLAATPLDYRALAYGIFPTILAQWLTLLCFTLLLVWVQRGWVGETRRPSLMGGALLLVVLAASLIAFPTIAAFNTLVIGLLAVAWLRQRQWRLGWTLVGVLGAAWVVALVAYYGQYVSEVVNTTLPALLAAPPAAVQGLGSPAAGTVHWTGPLDLLGWTAGYLVSTFPVVAGLDGLALLWAAAPVGALRVVPLRAQHGARINLRPARMLGLLTAAWISILPLFLVVNYRVDMIGKHLFYTMVPLALGSGLFLWGLARRGRAARLLTGLLAGALAWTALTFWIARLVQASAGGGS